jgi:tetratricopeptide (TPR) repeat protein
MHGSQCASNLLGRVACFQITSDVTPQRGSRLQAALNTRLGRTNLCALMCSVASVSASYLGFIREADIYASQKKLPQAAKLYDIALGKGAGNDTVIKLQRVLRQAGDVNNADKQLANWISQHPQDTAVRSFSAQLSLAQGHNQEAIAQYQEILKVVPKSVLALNNLAILYQKEKDSRAIAVAEQALKLGPDRPGIQDTVGWILVEQGQLPRGVELLRKAAAKAPNDGSVRYHFGVALAHSGAKKEAKKEIEAAIASGQTFPELDEAKTLLIGL